MTSPLAGGGQSFTLQPGQAVMLTEYAAGPDAPLTIINTSSATVYVAELSSVSPSNGVPVSGGTSLPWTTPGQIWAVLDPAATAPATVVITGAVSAWQPSPYAIAAAVAAQLLEQGVPNVLRSAELFLGQSVSPGAPVSVDGSQYASATVYANPIPPSIETPSFTISQLDESGDVVAEEFVRGIAPVTIALVGKTVVASNNGTHAAYVNMTGSNRPATSRFDSRIDTAGGYLWSLPNQNFASGSTSSMNGSNGGTLTQPQLSGQCFATFQVGSAMTACHFQIVQLAGPITTAQIVATSGEMIASDFGTKILTKMIAVPSVPYVMEFVANIAAASAPSVFLMPCSP